MQIQSSHAATKTQHSQIKKICIYISLVYVSTLSTSWTMWIPLTTLSPFSIYVLLKLKSVCFKHNKLAAAAAAKSLQSCPTLCDPIDGSPPGSLIPRIFQARVLEWVAIAFSVFPSIRVFFSESALRIRWPKHWSFNFSISLSNEHPGLISFRMDWLDLLAVQGTLKSLLQHHSSKASILRRSAFFIAQLLTSIHDYWKYHSLD